MEIAGGVKEDGIIIGNLYDKYGSANPIVKWMMNGFNQSLTELVSLANPENIHEIGCGEGHWVIKWHKEGKHVKGSDFSAAVIEMAKRNAITASVPDTIFSVKSIYDLTIENDSADLIVCCEVLEHLEDPDKALQVLQAVVSGNLIVSVPREPIWRLLNLLRFKYVSTLGNTPGHLQNWSSESFIKLLAKYFHIVEIRKPLPWTMLLCEPIIK